MARGEQVMGATPPIIAGKDHDAPSLFQPQNLLREARRQKRLAEAPIPEFCVLDPDGDIVRHLQRKGAARTCAAWACYHTDLHEFVLDGRTLGVIGCAVGAPFAVLLAEQMFASGCRFLLSITSAGQIVKRGEPPYFVVIERALRDEGASYHYLPPAEYAEADRALTAGAMAALEAAGIPAQSGAAWTTDAPFRETEAAIEAARQRGILAVEMEAAALYAFASARRRRVLCLAHVTNTMAQQHVDFEKGEADGATQSLRVIAALAALS
jgi:uridine phosphorylase